MKPDNYHVTVNKNCIVKFHGFTTLKENHKDILSYNSLLNLYENEFIMKDFPKHTFNENYKGVE